MDKSKLVSKSISSFDYENQILSIRTEMEGIINKVFIEQVDFRDECVRKALIALGWTPPPSLHNSDYVKCPSCGELWNIADNNSCQCGASIKSGCNTSYNRKR